MQYKIKQEIKSVWVYLLLQERMKLRKKFFVIQTKSKF